MTDAKDDILRRVRENLEASRAHDPAPTELPPVVHAGQSDPARLVGDFIARTEPLGTHVHRIESMAALSACVGKLIEVAGARLVALSDSPELRSLRSLPASFAADDLPETLLGCDLGVTMAQWAIAETGTLVLVSSAERHRNASLLPPIHVCVVAVERLLPDLESALGRVGSDCPDGISPAITFITGPSRTADIELTLVVGVHGPRELHVVLVG